MDLNWINTLILLFLGLNTLRELLAWSGMVPHDSKYSKIVYGRYDEQVVERALRQLGFSGRDEYDSRVVERALKQLGFERRDVEDAVSRIPNHPGVNAPFFQLLDLIFRNLSRFDRTLTYGRQSPIDSQFYINTMEAVHDRNQLVLMCLLLNALLARDIHISGEPYPDFVLTPKTGNPILSKRFAEMNNLLSLLRKGDLDTSRARFDRAEPLNNLLINFEGARGLHEREAQRRISGRRALRGVAIDCNASGGSAILESMSELNDLIRTLNLHIEPVTKAFILFRPDNNDDIDTKFSNSGYRIHRFFDLDEDIKEEIFKSGISEALRRGEFGKLSGINKMIIDKGLLKTEISPDEFR